MDPPQLRHNLHFSICENIKFNMKLTIFKKDSASHFQEDFWPSTSTGICQPSFS